MSPSSYSSSKASAWCNPTSFKRPDIILPINTFWLFPKCQNTDPPSRNTFLRFSLYKEWPHSTRAAIWQVHISKINFLSVQYRHNFLCFRQQIKLLLENPVNLSFFLLIRFLLSNLGSTKASMEGEEISQRMYHCMALLTFSGTLRYSSMFICWFGRDMVLTF